MKLISAILAVFSVALMLAATTAAHAETAPHHNQKARAHAIIVPVVIIPSRARDKNIYDRETIRTGAGRTVGRVTKGPAGRMNR